MNATQSEYHKVIVKPGKTTYLSIFPAINVEVIDKLLRKVQHCVEVISSNAATGVEGDGHIHLGTLWIQQERGTIIRPDHFLDTLLLNLGSKVKIFIVHQYLDAWQGFCEHSWE